MGFYSFLLECPFEIALLRVKTVMAVFFTVVALALLIRRCWHRHLIYAQSIRPLLPASVSTLLSSTLIIRIYFTHYARWVWN